MWIVRLALRRPYTFVVMSIAIVLMGIFCVNNMATDIFPEVDIPVISVIWRYDGMSPDEMEGRIIRTYEGICTTIVNDIEHIESQSVLGEGVVRIYFQPNAKIEEALAEVAAVSQTALKQMPAGITPPLIMRYSASTVPIIWLSLGSNTLPEQQLFDITNNFLRSDLATVQGAMLPWPYGGKQRQVMVDVDPAKMYGYGLSAADVSNAINNQNLILPSGTAKMGTQEYTVHINNSTSLVNGINDMPIKSLGGSTVYIKDVAHVSDKYMPQTNMVHVDGKKGVLEPIYKLGGASTLSIVQRVKAALPAVLARVPRSEELKVTPLFDQSVFVRAAVSGVVKEAAIAAGLTGLMILVFLGSWRSTIIICISIPLSITVSIIMLWAMKMTLNVMTLGGMALAVGILVDDATVEIENIHRNLHQRKRLVQAILDGASQIAVPAFVSTLCICIVFVPVWFITGAAKSLFTPLAMSVIFAMLTSYFLSRTLVPTMVHYLLESEVEMYGGVEQEGIQHTHVPHRDEHVGVIDALGWALAAWAVVVGASLLLGGIGFGLLALFKGRQDAIQVFPAGIVELFENFPHNLMASFVSAALWLALILLATALVYFIMKNNWIWRAHQAFNVRFEKFRAFYGGFLAFALHHRISVLAVFVAFVVGSCALFPFIGQDFFPAVDAGQIRLHVRGPAGTRLEESERNFAKVEAYIRTQIPPEEVDTIIDNIGIPNSGINMSLSDGSGISPADGEILISLKEDHHPTERYIKKLRKGLPQQFAQNGYWFQAADIATQILNFGLPAPIDVQVRGSKENQEKNFVVAEELRKEISGIPGAVDVHVHQVMKTPDLNVMVNRTMADQVGVTQQRVANDVLISLSSSGIISPNYWLDPRRGVQYSVSVMTPQYQINSINALQNTPVTTPTGSAELLGNFATIERGYSPTNISHYNITPTFDVQANVQDTDLGSVSNRIDKLIQNIKPKLPKGTTITVLGQVASMKSSFGALAVGILGAVVLVYLLMVVNFQSWLDPMIILMALPGALSGILWMLFATRTTINVPSLMGAIMCIGVATANSILMITFANDYRKDHEANAHDAALAAGMTRLRPVIMTALAMILGMLPMSLGLGEGGEQNAPLGRAVIGGLTVATFYTLFFVPMVYSALRTKAPHRPVEPELQEA
ncbi:MAG TPA: efflux RND transporter permease subunit [Tepidisphaeraceae bacterium]|jgi:multidrug efflux pump subunit AcrB|nr:efflux RND transporter permease subunit [Tepidisphaeraceae bacterium]